MEAEAKVVNYKLRSNENKQLKKLSDETLDNEMEKDTILNNKDMDLMIPWYNFERPFKVTIPTRDEWMKNNFDRKRRKNAIYFYTDGSKIEEKTGFGVFSFESFCTSKKMEDETTIFQAEAHALIYCARKIVSSGLRNKNIYIFSDSQAVLKSLLNPKVTSRTIADCIFYLSEASVNNVVNLIWIPGHGGLLGNEKADELAKQGATLSKHHTEVVNGKMSVQTVKTRITNISYVKAELNWHTSLDAWHSKQIMGNYSMVRTEYLLKLNRTELSFITSLLTGHGQFKKHLHRLRVSSNSNCRFCGEVETAEHWLCECEAFSSLRWKYFNKSSVELTDFSSLKINLFCEVSKRIHQRLLSFSNE
jgi:ribonuclease HI